MDYPQPAEQAFAEKYFKQQENGKVKKRKGNKEMITKTEINGRPIQICHDSGLRINFSDLSWSYSISLPETVGYGSGSTPLEAIDEAVRGVLKFDKQKLLADYVKFADDLKEEIKIAKARELENEERMIRQMSDKELAEWLAGKCPKTFELWKRWMNESEREERAK